MIEKIGVPFTDGKRIISISAPAKELKDSECRSLNTTLQKALSLHIIDKSWTDHLREMDDLKQSVRNATYEQKDPLLVYKFEGFELFKKLMGHFGTKMT